MTRGLFVTGTDTGSGKTHVAADLIRRLRGQGIGVAGFKPVASGGELHDGNLRNDDALTLADASGLALPYATVNPYCFAPPIAPHLAAAEAGVQIDLDVIRAAYDAVGQRADIVIVEGAGGWHVPLGGGLDIAGLARALALPVLLVVGLRLGCINHARLTESAILASGVRLIGWIGSQIDPHMARLEDNLATLDEVLESPCLGVLTHARGSPPQAAPAPPDTAAILAMLGGRSSA